MGEWGVENREGIKPSRAVLQTAILIRESARRAGSGNRTRIHSLEDCGLAIRRCTQIELVPQTGIVAEPPQGGETHGAAIAATSPAIHAPRRRLTPPSAPSTRLYCVQHAGLRTVAFTCPVFHGADLRFSVPFHWAAGAVESARIELASPGCRPGSLPLKYDPAGREGIEPSLRVLEARLVTMTLRPKN